MKKLEKNIWRHENGILYFVARRSGKLSIRSLRTENLEKARKIILENGIKSLTAARKPREPAKSCPRTVTARRPAPLAVPLLEGNEKNDRAAEGLTLAEALERHSERLVLISPSTREMAERGRKICLKYGRSLVEFSPILVWNSYRKTGIKRLGRELTSSANHLLWFLRKFIPWAVREGYLPNRCDQELLELKKVKVNSRKIRVPSVAAVNEFLQMVDSEDSDGASFLRFLAVTGLRRGGAIGLEWQDIDLELGQMVVRQKGGRQDVIPMTLEARELLASRRHLPRPFSYGIKKLEVLERRMKRFAKGLDIDLNTFHAFRHYFASRCLLSNLTVPETSKLLGHNDGGTLVLKTYGHLCGQHLKDAVNGLRLAS